MMECLIFNAQNASLGDPLSIMSFEGDEGDLVFAEISELPDEMNDCKKRQLALVVLWFLWCHEFQKDTYVVILDDQEECRFGYGDYSELKSLFFPSQS